MTFSYGFKVIGTHIVKIERQSITFNYCMLDHLYLTVIPRVEHETRQRT